MVPLKGSATYDTALAWWGSPTVTGLVAFPGRSLVVLLGLAFLCAAAVVPLKGSATYDTALAWWGSPTVTGLVAFPGRSLVVLLGLGVP